MGLWYETPEGFARAHLGRETMGTDAYLCCPGPSLAGEDLSLLRRPGITTFALNTAYPRVRPDVWIGADRPRCYAPDLWWEPFMKICRGGYQDLDIHGHPLSKMPNIYFADCARPEHLEATFTERGQDATFVWNGNSFALALHIIIWLGAREIHLVGCDMGGPRDYYDDRVLPSHQHDENRRLYRGLVVYLERLSRIMDRYGVCIRSCTADSPINGFLDYAPLEEAARRSRGRVPELPTELLHSRDAEALVAAEEG